MEKENKSLGEVFPDELERVIELRGEYQRLPNGVGQIGAALMTVTINQAKEAQKNGNVIQMMVAYEELKKHTR